MWHTKNLGDIVNFERGLTYSKKDEVDYSANAILRANNIILESNTLDLSEIRYINDDIKIPENKKVKKDCLIICTASGSKSHLGKVALIDRNYNFAFGGFMGQITPKSDINSKYLFYNFISDRYRNYINKLSNGVNINNLKFSSMENFEIPLPSLEEQQRIVKLLDEIFEKIDIAKINIEKNIQNSKELFESYLQNIFVNFDTNWQTHKLGDIYDVRDGTHESPKYKTDGYALITSKNLKKGKIDYKNTKYISVEDYQKINERSKVSEGDILFAMIGTIGNPVVVETEPNFAIKNVALFKVPAEQSSYFLKYYLDSKFVIDKMMKEAKGSTQKFVGLGYLRDFIIHLPELSEQKKIIERLDILSNQTQELENNYKKQIENLMELKKSILDKAFKGEL
jgi:type I restriction enzyme S subunit